MRLLLIVLAAASLLGSASVEEAPQAAPAVQRLWLGADGTTLPLQTDEEVLEFLRTAEISLLLGLDNVPPMVIRKHGREDGSLQMWVEESMTEGERMDRRLDNRDEHAP